MTNTISEGIVRQIESQANPTEERFTLQNSILISLSFRKIGTRRKAKKEQIEFGRVSMQDGTEKGVDKEFMDAQATILKSETLDLISKRDNQVAKWVQARCLPMTRLFRAGIYLLPPDLVAEVDAEIEGYKAERLDLVEKFAQEYMGIKEAMRDKLGPHFNESFYLGTEEAVKAQFDFDARYVSFDVPVTMKGISESMYRREQERVRKQVEAQAQDIEDTLAETGFMLLAWLQEQLSSNEDGSKKRIVENKLQFMREFFDNLKARNITGSKTLSEVAEQGRLVMGMAAGTSEAYRAMKESSSYRQIIQSELEKVKETLKPLIVDGASRKFANFSEEEED